MTGALIRLLGKGLGEFLSYKSLVELSSKVNFPLSPPLIASVDVTLNCNSKCSYCDIWRIKNDFQEISLDKFDSIFRSLKKLGVRLVSLSGGEPLMRNDLDEVIALAKSYGMVVHVSTNGILLTKERALRLAVAGVDSLILSLDTLDPEVFEKHRGVPFKLVERAIQSLSYISKEYPDLWAAINCVITRHNIGTLVPFVNWISEYGSGRILVTLQPYHRPSPFLEMSKLPPKMQKQAKELLPYYQDKFSHDDLIPGPELRPVFENEIQELIQLKKLKPGLPLNDSEFYLRSMPGFLFDNKMPHGFDCVAGYVGIFIRSDLLVCPCWRLLPVGDLEKEELTNIWFSPRFRKQRVVMKHLKCPGCMALCHSREPDWWEWYNLLYKSHRSKAPRITW
jgi:MoaA/NifB/PqqE/SkfB family radical SAM enzyme